MRSPVSRLGNDAVSLIKALLMTLGSICWKRAYLGDLDHNLFHLECISW